MFLSIILPTYNESQNLPLVFWLIEHYLGESKFSFEVIVVDDNSPDGTLEVARHLQSIYGKDKVVLAPRPGKLGLGTFNFDDVCIYFCKKCSFF